MQHAKQQELFIAVSLLITIGIVFSYSLSSYIVLLFDYKPYHFVLRHAIFGISAILVMWALSHVKKDPWLHVLGMTLLFGAGIVMIAMPFMSDGWAVEVGGAKRWINLKFFSIAPVEFFKVGFVYFLAWSLDRKYKIISEKQALGREFNAILPYLVAFSISVFLIAVMQNDLGQVVVLSLTLIVMLMFSGSSYKLFAILLSAGLATLILFIAIADHRIMRVKSWWMGAQHWFLSFLPESIASKLRIGSGEEGYQIAHSLNAVHNGGLFGVGMGNGVFKLGFLSEVHTDFVLSGIAEEFGFLGVLLVSLLMLFVLYRILVLARTSIVENRVNESGSLVGFLFGVGVTMLIAGAFLVNAFGISSITPIKGISVPFISYGGSSMIATAIAIGMVMMGTQRGGRI